MCRAWDESEKDNGIIVWCVRVRVRACAYALTDTEPDLSLSIASMKLPASSADTCPRARCVRACVRAYVSAQASACSSVAVTAATCYSAVGGCGGLQ